jgi:hypothetical protein
MTDTLQLACSRAASLPEPAREKLAREILDRIDSLSRLRVAVDAGLAELDAGRRSPGKT